MVLNLLKLIWGIINSIIMFSLPIQEHIFFYILKLSLKQLIRPVIPLLENLSWQPFTICFSNSFPASLAQAFIFRSASFVSSNQSSVLAFSHITPSVCKIPSILKPVSRLYLFKAHVHPTRSTSSPISIVFPTQKLYYFAVFILLFS